MTPAVATPSLPDPAVRSRLHRACNLVLIANRKVNQEDDFGKVARYAMEYAPHVSASVWLDYPYKYKRFLLAGRPTFVFSAVPLQMFKPVRGVTFQGNSLAKSDEYAALERCGIPVPRYRIICETGQPDVTDLGPYVVVKPDRGGRGAKIRIMRSSRVRWEPAETRVSGRSDNLLAQEFIYTGPWPASYRVTTLFGQVLWSLKVEADHTRAPLAGADAFKQTPGLTVVSNSKGCTMALNFNEEIIRFAEDAHRAFPEIPLLGIDVIRDANTGKLYVVEVNASGYVWHFSSPLGSRAQKEFGFSLEGQFDGIRKAARILADKAQELAR